MITVLVLETISSCVMLVARLMLSNLLLASTQNDQIACEHKHDGERFSLRSTDEATYRRCF